MALTESDSELSVGENAPSFKLEDFDGKNVRLADLDNYDGVLVVFMCNHCPYVKTQMDEFRNLIEEFSSIAFVGINPNAKTHPDDSIEKMSEFVEQYDLEKPNFYYLIDEDQQVAASYNAECTPDPFLLDWRHRLYYKGRLNDKLGPDDEATEREMKNVITRMLKRKDSPEKQKASQGCSIKWKD